jgi:RNA polymerase sigma-54 factor
VCSSDLVLGAVLIITSLEPKPGRQYSDEETIYISPDIYVFKVGDDYEIVLNEDGLPKLKINGYYRDILTSKEALEDGTKQYIRDKLKSAAWLIKSIHQRQRTIYRVTNSIVRFQREFLDKGVTHLRPLVLRNVAEDIEMHESTISRVTTNKYVHTPQGLFELKYFFNSAIQCLDGESVSSETVKEHLKNILKSENRAKPYSDQEIADMLKEHNIDAARRTVAKYREALGILPSRKRKKPY